MNKAPCGCVANYRYTWPGRNESYVCQQHASMAKRISDAIGFHLQIIEASPEEAELRRCEQPIELR